MTFPYPLGLINGLLEPNTRANRAAAFSSKNGGRKRPQAFMNYCPHPVIRLEGRDPIQCDAPAIIERIETTGPVVTRYMKCERGHKWIEFTCFTSSAIVKHEQQPTGQ